jgi:hypothetical protein
MALAVDPPAGLDLERQVNATGCSVGLSPSAATISRLLLTALPFTATMVTDSS